MKVFSDIFSLSEIDPDGKIFDEVSRGLFTSEQATMYMDYHTGLLKCKKMDKMEIAIFSNENKFAEKDVPEKYHYLLGNGVLYRKEEKDGEQILDISFSGLLVQLKQKEFRIKDIDQSKRLFLGVSTI